MSEQQKPSDGGADFAALALKWGPVAASACLTGGTSLVTEAAEYAVEATGLGARDKFSKEKLRSLERYRMAWLDRGAGQPDASGLANRRYRTARDDLFSQDDLLGNGPWQRFRH